MMKLFRRFWPLIALILLLGISAGAMSFRERAAGENRVSMSLRERTAEFHRRRVEAESRKTEGPYLTDVPNHEVDMTWEDGVYGGASGTDLVNKVKVTRTGVWSGGTLTACSLEITYTAASAADLNRVRLLYTPSSGSDVVLDDASEANSRIGSTDARATVSGTVPVTAKAVKLLWTPDGGSEQIVQEWTLNQ